MKADGSAETSARTLFTRLARRPDFGQVCAVATWPRTSTWHTGSPREMAAEAEVIAATKRLLGAVGSLDYATYEKLSSDDLTCVEPETQGHVVQGLAFHKCARE